MANNRILQIKKQFLIDQIEVNKENHIKDYEEAVIAYAKEGEKQLKKLLKEVRGGSLNIKLQLVSPVNKADEYDKLIEMFSWETRDEIELTRDEFNEYVLDESSFAIQSKFLNSTYRG